MGGIVALLLVCGLAGFHQAGAKAMFYDPGGVGQAVVKAPPETDPRLRPILWSDPFPQFGRVGIHYWFEDANRKTYSETQAATLSVPLTLHIRGNVGATLTVWSVEGAGAELTPRNDQRWAGHFMYSDTFVVPETFRFQPGERATRLIVVFGRSQTEMAFTADDARRALDLSSRLGVDRLPQVARETDDSTPGEIGTYVINREGMPIAAEIVMRSR